jgi:hypothetical protein
VLLRYILSFHPKLFPYQYFYMLEDPCVHVKIQNALMKGHTHQIMEYNQSIFI